MRVDPAVHKDLRVYGRACYFEREDGGSLPLSLRSVKLAARGGPLFPPHYLPTGMFACVALMGWIWVGSPVVHSVRPKLRSTNGSARLQKWPTKRFGMRSSRFSSMRRRWMHCPSYSLIHENMAKILFLIEPAILNLLWLNIVVNFIWVGSWLCHRPPLPLICFPAGKLRNTT